MATFYTDSGSFSELEVSGSVLVSGSGRDIFAVSGSNGGLLSVSDLTAGANVFQITSASVDVFKINQSKEVHISGSLIVTGSIIGNGSVNVSAGTTSNNVSQLVLSNSNSISFGLNGSTITATADITAAAAFTYPYFNPQDAYVQAVSSIGNGSLRFQPIQAPNVQHDRIAIPIYMTNNAASTMNFSISISFGLYSRNASTLSLMTDRSVALTLQSTLQTSNASLFHGLRLWTTGFTGTITEGQYYAGFVMSTTTGNQAGTISNVLASQATNVFNGIFGQSSAASVQYTRGLGQYSSATNALPSSVALSSIVGTASNYLRQPAWYLVSQTF